MAKTVEWMYHRKGCQSCKKAHAFFAEHAIKVKSQTETADQKYGREEAVALARTVNKVVTGRGKNVVTIDLKKDAPDDDTLAAALLGPTGNLKAPTLKLGKTLLVGYNEQTYADLLG